MADLTLVTRAKLIICYPAIILIDFITFIVSYKFIQNPAHQRFLLINAVAGVPAFAAVTIPLAFLAGERAETGLPARP